MWVESEGLSPCLVDWDIYTVSILGETSSLPFTACFFATTRPWHRTQDDEIALEQVLVNRDESKTILLAFDGIVRIDKCRGSIERSGCSLYRPGLNAGPA